MEMSRGFTEAGCELAGEDYPAAFLLLDQMLCISLEYGVKYGVKIWGHKIWGQVLQCHIPGLTTQVELTAHRVRVFGYFLHFLLWVAAHQGVLGGPGR